MTEKEKTELRKEKNRAYNIANKDRIAEVRRLYALKNKDRIAATSKAWKLNNKSKVAKHNKTYKENNKEAISETNRVWRENNKEHKSNVGKAYYKANKESMDDKNKAIYESKKLPYNIIYCIPDYDNKGNDYAGVTNNPSYRMRNHKSQGKLNTADFFILDVVVDRVEAEASESRFHAQGYHGAKPIKQ